MKLEKYHIEILSLLDEKYPKSLRKSSLLALLSDKNPDKFKRETEYLKEHGFLEIKVVRLPLEIKLPFGTFPFDINLGLKITAKGIDILKRRKKDEERYTEKRKKVKRPIAFISASFDNSAEPLIKWVRNRAENVGFTTLWLKEIYQARPTIDKIDQAIRDSDCIIQVLTSHIFEKGSEAGWIGNELGMAFKSRPKCNIAVFVQKGYQASGLAKYLTDIFTLDPENLPQQEKKAEEYLLDLKNRIRILDKEEWVY